jgi:membrane-anchored protein YejM (alkaline phosphatase superfamily)
MRQCKMRYWWYVTGLDLTHQFSCFETSILLSVLNLYLIILSSSTNKFYTAVLRTHNEVLLLHIRKTDSFVAITLQLIPSSWEVLVNAITAPLCVVKGLQILNIDVILITSCELVEDSQMGTAIGPRSRYTCQMIHFSFSPVSFALLFGVSVLELFAPNGLQQAPWGVVDRLLANKPELNRPSSHFSMTPAGAN